MDRYGKLMPKREHRKLMLELAGIHYNTPVEMPVVNIEPTSRSNRAKITKSPATLIAEKQSAEIKSNAPIVTDTLPVVQEPVVEQQQVIVKPENVITIPSGVKIPKGVVNILGQTIANIQVLSYNETESATPRGQNGKLLPHVNCHCNTCNSDFVMNAYWITGGSKKDCGCTSKRKG